MDVLTFLNADIPKKMMAKQHETYGREEQTSKRYGHAWKKDCGRYELLGSAYSQTAW